MSALFVKIIVYIIIVVTCCLLITFANSSDPDQARQNVGPDLDPNCLTLMVFLKEFFEKVDFEKYQQTIKEGSAVAQW